MKPINVLLVDDDEDDYVLTKGIFKQLPHHKHYTLTWCNNYENAINAMLKQQYDVFLVDYRLGKQTGIDLLNEAMKSNCQEPIIILTGKGDYQIDEEAMKAGAADYLVKDIITPQSLERSLRYAIEQNKALKALKESENKFRIIFERSKDPMLITDYAGTIYDINPAGLSLFGYTHDEIGRTNLRSFYKRIEDHTKFTQLMEAKGAINDFECQMISKSGEVHYCSISSFLQISQHDISELYHSTIRDLTIRKKLEEQAVNNEKLAVSERIAISLADEIRDPLSNVNLSIDALVSELGTSANANAELFIDIIKKNCEKINYLINDFIASTATGAINAIRTDVIAVINDTLDSLESQLLNNQVDVEKHISLQPILISIDPDKIRLALRNLFVNAIEAMDDYPKKITVRTELNNTAFIISISDTGPGINKTIEKRIFEPFFTTRLRASGLGLTNTQSIIMAHHGSIEVQSNMEGTTFTITIPVRNDSDLWL